MPRAPAAGVDRLQVETAQNRERATAWRAEFDALRPRVVLPCFEALLAGIVAAGLLAIEVRVFAVALLG